MAISFSGNGVMLVKPRRPGREEPITAGWPRPCQIPLRADLRMISNVQQSRMLPMIG